jgi:RHS repeat-associated protein
VLLTDSYDAAGRVTTRTVGGNQVSAFTYDSSSQLVGVSGTLNESFAYDSNGNRAGVSLGNQNRVLGDGTYSYTYDKEGRLKTKTRIGTSEVTTYAYDPRGRLTQVNLPGGVVAKYFYDALDQRVKKEVTSGGTTTTTLYVYSGGEVLQQYNYANGSATPTHHYLFAPAVDQVMADEVIGDIKWQLADYEGSIRDIASARYGTDTYVDYSAFGQDGTLPVDALFGYIGGQYDRETGLSYLKARYYDPAQGRFLSPDPLGFSGGDANLYRYAGNDPINRSDPSGLRPGFSYSPPSMNTPTSLPTPEDIRLEQGARLDQEMRLQASGRLRVITFQDDPRTRAIADRQVYNTGANGGFWAQLGGVAAQTIYEFNYAMGRIFGESQAAPDPTGSLSGMRTAQDVSLTVAQASLALAGAVGGRAVSGAQSVSRAAQLEVLNREFVPNGTRVLQNLTTRENAKLIANPGIATTVLSKAEVDAAVSSRVGPLQYGRAVEKLVAKQIGADPHGLGTLFEYNRRGVGPDFYGPKGQIYDITTEAQSAAHINRYGPNLNVITYERPPGFR